MRGSSDVAEAFEQTLGQGDTDLVWLHGWGQTHAALAPLAKILERHGRHRLIDLPGFGQTPRLADGAGSAAYAAWLSDMLGAKTRRRILLGHSFGVRVAVQLAAREPDAVDALVLIAGAGLKRQRPWSWYMRARALTLLGRLARLTGRHEAFRRRFGSADYKAAGALRGTLVAVVNEDLSEQARAVRCPVLLLYGAQDEATPPQLGERFAALMPDARLKIYPHLGHLDILSRGAQLVAHAIETFLTEISRQ